METICARCGGPMSLTPLGTANAYGCSTCRGVLLSHDHAARVREGIDRIAPVQAERAAAGVPLVDASRDVGVLPCPLCRQPMGPEWLSGGRVRIDTCPVHGVFFDAHELAALVPQRSAPLIGKVPGKESPGSVGLGLLLDVFLG